MSPVAEGLAIALLFIVAALAPSVMMVYVAFRSTRAPTNPKTRIIIRSIVGSIALTPSIYGHAGPVCAWWILFLGNERERVNLAIIPIAIVTAVALCINFARYYLQESKKAEKNNAATPLSESDAFQETHRK